MLADLIIKVASEFFNSLEDSKYYPRPSSASPRLKKEDHIGRCERQMTYDALGYRKKKLAGRAVIVFDDSSWHEELTAEWLRKSALLLSDSQMKVKADFYGLTLGGSIDGILTDIMGGKWLYEHKAINHVTWERFAFKGEIPYDYFCQASIYLDAVRRDADDELKGGILLIKNKNTSQYMEFIFDYDSKEDICLIKTRLNSVESETEELNIEVKGIVKQAILKFNRVERNRKKKELPKRDYELDDDWQCSYCPFSDTCWGEDYEKDRKEFVKITDIAPDDAELLSDALKHRDIRLASDKIEKSVKKKLRILHREHKTETLVSDTHISTLVKTEKTERLTIIKKENNAN